MTALCPQCHRRIQTHDNSFGDQCFNHHQCATAWSPEMYAEYAPGYNRYALTLDKIVCPMSGQAVESEMR